MANEKQFYDLVAEFMRKSMGCYAVKKEVGVSFGSIDVLGIRNVSKDLSSRYELVSIEVKENKTRFLNSVGQAIAYSVAVHRCYLAYHMPTGQTFNQEYKDIADHFGVGLISLSPNRRPKLISTSSLFSPKLEYSAKLIDKLECFSCTLCGSILRREDVTEINASDKINPTEDPKYVGNLSQAIAKRRAARWYLYDVASAKKEKRSYIYDRRYLCKDCVSIFASLNIKKVR